MLSSHFALFFVALLVHEEMESNQTGVCMVAARMFKNRTGPLPRVFFSR